MRCSFFLFIVLLISSCIYSQEFPFGVYYYLPKTGNSSSLEFEIREITISPGLYKEQYVDKNFQPLKEGAMPEELKIETVFRKGTNFYMVFIQENKYLYAVYRTNTKNKYPVLELRANNYIYKYDTRQAAIEAARKDSLPFLPMTYFTKSQYKGFEKLKPVDSLKLDGYKIVLRKIAELVKQRQQIYTSILPANREMYKVSRFFDISYLYFFTGVGIAPFINGEQYNQLYEKYKYDPEVRSLYNLVQK